MAYLFLKGVVSPAKHRVDIVYTQNDLKTLPPAFCMPYTYLPYITCVRNVFLDQGDSYTGDADVAVTAGFVNNGDLSQAKHAVYYAWSPYRDALRHTEGGGRLERLAAQTDEALLGANLGERILVFNDIVSLAGKGDYTAFATILDTALKRWGLLPCDRGLVGDTFVSDTGELAFNPKVGFFQIRTKGCSYFSGNPVNGITLTDNISLKLRNHRISVALMPVKEESLEHAKTLLLTILGTSGMDETVYNTDGLITTVDLRGKLYVETAEGTLLVRSKSSVTLTALDMVGNPVTRIEGVNVPEGVIFTLDGTVPAVHFLLEVE